MARTRPAAALVISLGLASVSISAGDKWQRLDSRALVVVGNVPASTLKDIAVHLEQFRDVFARLLPRAAATAAVPMVVVAFPSERAYKPFMPSFEGKPVRVGGYFLRRNDADYITLNTEYGEQVYRIIFHEYAHSLVSNVLPSVPLWLGEGLAEYYSTFEAISSNRANVGRAIPEHVALFGTTSPLPIEQLLAVERDSRLYNESSRRTVFYAQSWALVHYLAVANETRSAQLSRFLGLLAGGTPQLDALREAFQCEPAELGKELSRYLSQKAFRYTQYSFTQPIGVDRAGEVTAISGAEADAYLADVLWRSGREAEARARLEAAMRAEPDNARAHAVLGTLEASRQQFDTAIEHLERAVALSPTNAVYQYDLGSALVWQVAQAGHVEAGDPRLRKATSALSQAVSSRPDYGEAMARQAQVMLLAGGDAHQAVTLVQSARRLLPGRDDYATIEANGLARLGKYPEARNVLGRVLARAASDSLRTAVREQLAQVAALEQRDKAASSNAQTTPAADAGPPTGGTGASPTSIATAPPRPTLMPALRVLEAGEQRVFGRFEAVECEGGTAAIRLAADAGTSRFLIRDWGEAQFISYREDVSGSITCGAQASPAAVLVTWRPVRPGTAGADGFAGELVALEIVPEGYVPR